MEVRFKPIGDRVLVKRDETESNKTESGILTSIREVKSNKGTIVAKGNGYTSPSGTQIALSLTDGQRVLFPQSAGSEITLDNGVFLLLRESEILGVLED